MLRLSFIVPFYGVEKYIEECIRSLYAQDIPKEDYEVICVDDCSLDGSRAIVERLQKEYETLRLLVHTENKRQGGARNTGLREAKGEYIWFVDSDDYICQNVLNTILSEAEKNNLDVLQFDYKRDSGETVDLRRKGELVQDGESYLFSDKLWKWSERVSGPWQQIIRKQFLQDERISFIEGAQYEDTDYMIHVFLKAQRVEYMPILSYIYRENLASTTQAVVSPQKLAWRVNQLARCAQLVDMCNTMEGKECMNSMLFDSFSYMRFELKKLPLKEKCIYLSNLTPALKKCRKHMNYPPWLAVRYGITWFI